MTNKTNAKKNNVTGMANITDVTSKSSITFRLLIYNSKENLRASVYVLHNIHVAITLV